MVVPWGDAILAKGKRALVLEIMLQANEKLYIKGKITRELYEQAKLKIVEMGGGGG